MALSFLPPALAKYLSSNKASVHIPPDVSHDFMLVTLFMSHMIIFLSPPPLTNLSFFINFSASTLDVCPRNVIIDGLVFELLDLIFFYLILNLVLKKKFIFEKLTARVFKL